MREKQREALHADVQGLEIESGNVRALAGQLIRVLLNNEMGEKPHKLAWAIAKEVGELNPKFTAKDVTKVLDNHEKELSVAPEKGIEYFQKQGKKGAGSLTHDEAVKYGKMGAKTQTKEQARVNGAKGAKSLTNVAEEK